MERKTKRERKLSQAFREERNGFLCKFGSVAKVCQRYVTTVYVYVVTDFSCLLPLSRNFQLDLCVEFRSETLP